MIIAACQQLETSLYSLVPVCMRMLYDVHVQRLYAAAYICYVTIMLTACCVRTVAASGGFRLVFTVYFAIKTVAHVRAVKLSVDCNKFCLISGVPKFTVC